MGKKRFTYKDYENCFFKVEKYINGNIALFIYDYEGPIATVTTNFEKLPDNQAYIKDYSENVGAYNFLLGLGIIKRLISHRATGYILLPLVELDLDKINEYTFE